MTAVLTAGVVLALALTVLNLVLTFAVVRKMRDGAGSGLSTHTPHPGLPQPGTRVGEFTAETTDGAVLTDQDLRGERSLIAFVSPTCAPCKDVIAEITAAGGALATPLYAFVAGDDDADTAAVVATLRPHGTVTVITAAHPAAQAFGGVDGYPALMLVTDGVIAAAGRRLADVREPAAVVSGPLKSLLP
jgi:hypothetical protein